jgi:predicted AAA+ superfamily ATPase
MDKIDRRAHINAIQTALENYPVTALLGPRQCGKSTISRTIAEIYKAQKGVSVHSFDLEDIYDLQRLSNIKLALDHLEGLIIIDEIQLKPELFPYLRVLADRYPDRRYLILGSASRDLIEKASETLAGRIEYIELTPFSLTEIPHQQKLLQLGGFPRSILATDADVSFNWRKSYIQSYLERDLPFFGIKLPTVDLYRFWIMVANYHGQLVNFSEIGCVLGLSDQTIRRYISILQQTFMVRCLQPWFVNIPKRQVKTPKLYLRDSGIYQALLDIRPNELDAHPKKGAAWEGFAIEEIIRLYKARPEECFFWRSSQGAELDLLIVRGEKKIAFEIKYSDHPSITKSMRSVMVDLSLSELNIVIPLVDANYYLDETIKVVGLNHIQQ